jgi:hypothetical protein
MTNYTPIPNRFFDLLMGDLSASAVRVYLKIARNTFGWRDAQGNVKKKDWISHSQFANAGVSSRSVTSAIEELLSLGLVRLTDELGQSLHDPEKRKRAKRIFYALVDIPQANTAVNNAKNDNIKRKNCLQQEKFHKKKYAANERMPDHIRLQQILQEEEEKQIKRDGWV